MLLAPHEAYLSHVTRKADFGVWDQVRFKPVYSVTETSLSLESLDLARIGLMLSRQRTTKARMPNMQYKGTDAHLACDINLHYFITITKLNNLISGFKVGELFTHQSGYSASIH